MKIFSSFFSPKSLYWYVLNYVSYLTKLSFLIFSEYFSIYSDLWKRNHLEERNHIEKKWRKGLQRVNLQVVVKSRWQKESLVNHFYDITTDLVTQKLHTIFSEVWKNKTQIICFIAFLPTSWIRWRSNKEWEKLLWWNWKLETWKFFKCIHSWNPTVVWKRLGFLKYHLTLYFLKNNY